MSVFSLPGVRAAELVAAVGQSGGALQAGVLPMKLLVTTVPDDSASMEGKRAGAVMCGHNEQLKAYRRAEVQTRGFDLSVRTRYLNGATLSGPCRPRAAIMMNDSNYKPTHGTPLYRETAKVLGEVEAFAAMHASNHSVRTFTFIMSDGEDSTGESPDHVRSVITRMIATGHHVVVGMGIGNRGNFTSVFRSMGIPENCIVLLEDNEADIIAGMGETAHTTVHTVDVASFTEAATRGFARDGASPPPSKRGRTEVQTSRAGVDDLAGMQEPPRPRSKPAGTSPAVVDTRAASGERLAEWHPVDRSPAAVLRFHPEIGKGEYVLEFPKGVDTMIVGRESPGRGLREKGVLIVEVVDPAGKVSRRHIKIERTAGIRGALLDLLGMRPDYRITILDKVDSEDDPFVAINGTLMTGKSMLVSEGSLVALSPDVKFRLGLPEGI